MLEDPLLDRQGGNPNIIHTLGLHFLTKIKQKYTLTDIFFDCIESLVHN